MKEKEVIKDYKVQKYVLYAEKEDGSYGTVEGGSYLIENDLDDFWHKKQHLEKTLREKLINNEISIIHYYMVLGDMTPAELASRAGICKRKVNKHLRAETFAKASVSDIQKYSRVFNVPVSAFFQIILTGSDLNPLYHFYHEENQKQDQYIITQTPTNNKNLMITKAEERK
jgi:transcriptional regulator with XRE-family HTH domain